MDRGRKAAQLEIHEAVTGMRWRLAATRWMIGATLFGAVSSCSSADIAGPPPLPTGAVSLPLRTEYHTWWGDTEQCAGVHADLARIAWFMVPDENFIYRGKAFDGYWWSVHWVVLASPFVTDPGIVRHEMLHDLLNRGDHPKEYFQQKCAGVVTCNAECRAEGDR